MSVSNPADHPLKAPDGAPDRAGAAPRPMAARYLGGGLGVLALVVLCAILVGGLAFGLGADPVQPPSTPQALDAER